MKHSIYKFDVMHYMSWCKHWGLNKNNDRVLQLFKARCEFEKFIKGFNYGKN